MVGQSRTFAASAVVAATVALTLATPVSGVGAGPALASDTVRLAIAVPTRSAAGARVLVQKGCVRCHALGQRPTGGQRIGPALDRELVSGTVMDLAGALWNHAPVMFARMQALKIDPPTMTAADVADVVAALSVFRVPSAAADRAGDADAGRRLFAAKRCATCHVADGSAWNGPGPTLQKYRGPSSGVFVAQAMWNHSAPMGTALAARGMAWPTFSGREMGDLIAFFRAGGDDTPDGDAYFNPGDPSRGAGLFRQKCAGCHAVDGRGGRSAPDLGTRRTSSTGSVAEIAACMWNHSPAMAAEAERRGVPFATFSGQEMIDVISYVNFVSFASVHGVPTRGRRLFAERCERCHQNAALLPHFDEPFAIIAEMWNHVPRMAHEANQRGVAWPRFANGEAADLAAFLLARH